MQGQENRKALTGDIRLGFAGMVEGNGHPFSWGAILNGQYQADIIAEYGYPGINDYLGRASPDELGIAGASVTHIWCDAAEDAHAVARSADIPHVVKDARDLIGHVDAVIIPTDKGEEHLTRALPFIEAGLPVFIDKPLTDNIPDLEQFIALRAQGAVIMSSSAMRYAREFVELKTRLSEVGEPRLVTVTCAKCWERYGIHALEAIYGLFAPGGWENVRNIGQGDAHQVKLSHASGVDALLALYPDLYGAFCHVDVYGTEGRIAAKFTDTFYAFRTQMISFLDYLRGDDSQNPFAQTVEQMQVIAAGIESKRSSGKVIPLRNMI